MIYADNYGDADSAALLRLDASSIFALLRHTFAGLRECNERPNIPEITSLIPLKNASR